MNLNTFFTKSSLYLSLILAFSMTMFIRTLPVIIALWAISLFIRALLMRPPRFKWIRTHVLMILLYVFYMAGFFWSQNRDAALFDLEVKFSLLLFPLMVALSVDFLKKHILSILLAFVLGCVLSSFICLGVACWESVFMTDGSLYFNPIDPAYADWAYGGSHFKYSNLSLFLHPTYFSFYLLFAGMLVVFMLQKKLLPNKRMQKSLIATLPLFLLMIYLLSSKAVLISTLLLLLVIAFMLVQQAGRYIIKIPLILFIFVFIVIALQNPRFSTVVRAFSHPELVYDHRNDDSFISRVHIWRAALDIIGEHFLTGVSPGDTIDELVEKYKQYQFVDPLKIRTNAHNQFLETFIDLGLFGFLLLTSLLIVPFLNPKQLRNPLFMGFLLLMGFNFLFESILNTQAGVVFFSFFYCLLAVMDRKELQAMHACLFAV